MIVNIVRFGLACILGAIVGGWLGELTSGLSPEDRLRVRIALILILVAGLLFPAP